MELSRRELRSILARAKAEGLLRRIGGDATVMHWTERGLRIAVEYYDQD